MTYSHIDDEAPIVVRFDPWWFSGREDLLQRFFKEFETAVLEVADLSCDGVADRELPIDRDRRTGSPGTMKKAHGFLTYGLDTGEFPRSPACFVLEVVVRDTTTGNQAREKTLLQRK